LNKNIDHGFEFFHAFQEICLERWLNLKKMACNNSSLVFQQSKNASRIELSQKPRPGENATKQKRQINGYARQTLAF